MPNQHCVRYDVPLRKIQTVGSMTLIRRFILVLSALCLQACLKHGPNPADPYESVNRKIFKFNQAFDATVLRPPAQFYVHVIPATVRTSIDGVYMNINLIPSVINDLLQADHQHAIKDTWRFIVNTGLGVGGLFDPASKIGLPPHSNDLGLTFAHWGDEHSPYIVIPFLGPSTIRDWMGIIFEYTYFTPYPYISSLPTLYGALSFRYVDLRSQLLEKDRLLAEAFDQYSFIRDAYLQYRHYLIHPEQNNAQDSGTLYVDDNDSSAQNAPQPTPPIYVQP